MYVYEDLKIRVGNVIFLQLSIDGSENRITSGLERAINENYRMHQTAIDRTA